MNNEINTGGPAFPHMVKWHGQDVYEQTTTGGMTLRDWFAGKAMQAIIIAGIDDCRTHDAKAAHFAYNLADAMIAARNQPSKP
jgi:hypothetical protein